MKNKVLKVLSLGLITTMLVAGCGKKTEEVKVADDAEPTITVEADTTEEEKADEETVTEEDVVTMDSVERPNLENINFSDYIEVGDYSNLDLSVEKEEVSDDDITSYINNMLSSLAEYTDITDRGAQAGDKLTISYEGTIDGETFDGGSADNESFTLGDNYFLDDFEKPIYGAKLGDIVDAEVTFPDDYDEAVAGKTANFKIVIGAIQEAKYPELNEDTIKQLSSTATTEEELRAEVKESLSYSLESSYKDEAYSAVSEALQKISNVKGYPDDMYAYYKNVLYSYYSEYATIYGVSMADFLDQYCNMTVEEFDAQCEDYAKNACAQSLALYYVGEKEGIELSDTEYEDSLVEMASEYGYDSVDALKSEIEGYNGEYEMRENIYFDKVCSKIIELNS